MKLQSLWMEPNGPSGWGSGELVFGDQITELYGPNGCGKTPVIQSIAYALGYPVKFRDDIARNCAAVVLAVITEEGPIRIRRVIGSQFEVQLMCTGRDLEVYYFERDFTKRLFPLLGLESVVLTSTANEPVEPYMATLLPVFYLDQDHGYSSPYRAPGIFIKDQYVEMMRVLFGLQPKNSFDLKKLLIAKKRRLDQVDRLVVRMTSEIEDLGKELGGSRRSIDAIESDSNECQLELESLKGSRDVKSDAQSGLEAMIYEKRTSQRAARREIAEIETRMEGFEKIQQEVEVEINTLSLNEEARRVFASFEDICRNPSCGLFVGSSESYGKNLLYLRDQVKDLERNTGVHRARVNELTSWIRLMEDEIGVLEGKVRALSELQDGGGLISAISELMKNLISLQRERHNTERLENEEKSYIQLLNERETLQNDIASMAGTAGAGDLRLLAIRVELRTLVVRWLDILKTKNVSRDVTVDADFTFLFGSEKISQFHGSTLLRVILAIHTAIFELYVRDTQRKLRLLILDTPRQQDIEASALGEYIFQLKRLALERNCQIIFSSTEYHYECLDGDQEWSPRFPGAEQMMFLATSEGKVFPGNGQ